MLLSYAYLDESIGEARSDWAGGLIATPFFAEWWAQEKEQFVYSRDFVAAIEAVAATPIGFVGSKATRD